jgi:hypothetical protein
MVPVFGLVALVLAAAGLWAPPARAEAVPFNCTILDDGRAVRITVSNPASAERSCLVSCRFSTYQSSFESQFMCAHMVPAGANDMEMCTKPSGGAQLVKQVHGSADCIRR